MPGRVHDPLEKGQIHEDDEVCDCDDGDRGDACGGKISGVGTRG
jgi:hypothetical protein